MADWAAKRFWSTVDTDPEAGGWRVRLDGRAVRTPAGRDLLLPSAGLADAVAEEWQAQEGLIDPGTMPLTRTANSAIDKVAPQRAAVVAMLTEYGATDLLSYRAERPAELLARQSELWDPLLDWAAERFGARLAVTRGVMPVAQDPDALDRLARPMDAMGEFHLAAFHDLVVLSGSLVLAHAATSPPHRPDAIWELSRLDEEWQIRDWGRDEEADEVAARRRRDFLDAHRFWVLAG